MALLEALLIEDNPGDVRLTLESFRVVCEDIHLHVAFDGLEALAYLRHEGVHIRAPRPDFILLDLNLPRMNGHEILAQIKNDDSLKSIPTIIVTTSTSEQDLTTSYQLQANCVVTKPLSFEEFESLVRRICDFWGSTVRLPRQRVPE
jgi:two-component system, chemotaxis family, response regulator Rcp1